MPDPIEDRSGIFLLCSSGFTELGWFCNLHSSIYNLQFRRGHSSVGRAPALQAGSQGFESPCLHFRKAKMSRRSFSVGGPYRTTYCFAVPTEADAQRVADLGASALRKVTWRLLPFLFLLYL